MDTYTNAYMAATMPECGALCSIGSVAANFARTKSEEQKQDFLRYSNNSPLAECILANSGKAAYDEYLAKIQAKKESDAKLAAVKLERRQARAAAIECQRQRLKGLVKRLCQRLASSGH